MRNNNLNFYTPKTSSNIVSNHFQIKNGLPDNFSKNLGIYENPDHLLSISLGSAETTLLKLTSAYSVFVNGGKLVSPIMIEIVKTNKQFITKLLLYLSEVFELSIFTMAKINNRL